MTTPPTLGTLADLLAEWRKQIAAEEAWQPGQPMHLSNDELGQMSQCADALDARLVALRDQLAQVEQEMRRVTDREHLDVLADQLRDLAASLTSNKE